MQTVRCYNLYHLLLKCKHDFLVTTLQKIILTLDQNPQIRNHRSGSSRCCEAAACYKLPQKIALNQ